MTLARHVLRITKRGAALSNTNGHQPTTGANGASQVTIRNQPMNDQPMTRILLSGSAAKLFGREHIYQLATGDVREAVKAIDVNHPGFVRYLANSTQQGLPVPVVYGKMLAGSSVIAVGTLAEALPT